MSPRVAAAVLGLAAVPVAAGPVRAQRAAPVVRLAWTDPCQLVPSGELVARAEAEALLARMGVSLAWRRSAAGGQARPGEIGVVLVGDGPQPADGRPVLGTTMRRPSSMPVVWARVPNVRRAVGILRTGSPLAWPGEELRRLAVALGRVIAHEVVHALAPALPHGSGLMSGSLSRQHLTQASLPVDADVALALQAALRGDPLFEPARAALLAAETQLPQKDR